MKVEKPETEPGSTPFIPPVDSPPLWLRRSPATPRGATPPQSPLPVRQSGTHNTAPRELPREQENEVSRLERESERRRYPDTPFPSSPLTPPVILSPWSPVQPPAIPPPASSGGSGGSVPPPATPWDSGSTMSPPGRSWSSGSDIPPLMMPRGSRSNIPTTPWISEGNTLPPVTPWDSGDDMTPQQQSARNRRNKKKKFGHKALAEGYSRQASSSSSTTWGGPTSPDNGWHTKSGLEVNYIAGIGGLGTDKGMGGVPPPVQQQDAYLYDQPPWDAGDYSSSVLDPSFLKVTEAQLAINPLLAPAKESKKAYLEWNMLYPTDFVQRSSDPAYIGWLTGKDEPATFPRLTKLDIVCENYPWVIEVNAQNEEVGVTCTEVINAIATDLWKLVDQESYESLPKTRRETVLDAYTFNRSISDSASDYLGPRMRRVDFLENAPRFGGVIVDQELVEKICGTVVPGCLVMQCKERKPEVMMKEGPGPVAIEEDNEPLGFQVARSTSERAGTAANGGTVGISMQAQMTISTRALKLIEAFAGILFILLIAKLSSYH